MPMDDRKKRVLQAIVQDYIFTAEPIGSRTIARKYDLGVSSATIRNEMADLEDMGYIEQPYTSAGRVPSDKGYRFYVDCIMEKQSLSESEECFIKKQFVKKISEVERVIKQATEILSNLTQYTALIIGPNLGTSVFKFIQLSLLEEGKALLIIVTNIGTVQHKIIDIPPSISSKDLYRISHIFNSNLNGLELEKIKKTILDEIYTDLFKEKMTVKTIFELLDDFMKQKNDEKIFLGGTLNILEQPEFSNVDKIKTILGILEEKEVLKKLMRRDEASDGLIIKIGGENIYKEVHECSLITATYHLEGKVVGSIGILGPTRMQYSKTVAMVEYITGLLSNILSNKI